MSAINEFKDMPLSEFSETESASESTPVEKIPEYVPTQWVDETEPDIDADHLNHIENGIKKVTDGVNNIIENGGGSFVPSDGYVYIDQEESEENPDPVDVPLLDADTFGGQLPSYYAPQHEISDAFSEGRDYAAGDYCIFSNTLHRFTSSKPAGAWDGTKAVPVTVSQELAKLNSNLTATTPQTIHSQCRYSKAGNVVTVSCAGLQTEIPANTWTTLFTLPSGYRPNFDMHASASFASNGSKIGLVRVATSGECGVFSSEATNATWFAISFVMGG